MSESLTNVTETSLCNVREGGATISDAATIMILAIKTDVQQPTLSLDCPLLRLGEVQEFYK